MQPLMVRAAKKASAKTKTKSTRKSTAKKKAVSKTTASRKASAAKAKTRGRKPASKQAKPGLGGWVEAIVTRIVQAVMAYTAIAIAGAVVLVMIGLYIGGYFNNFGQHLSNGAAKAAQAAGFSVSRVTVKGATYTSHSSILDALSAPESGSVIGQSLLHVDPDEARQNVEQIGWVKYAAVSRLWPNTIHVSVYERRPAAIWRSEDSDSGATQMYLMDRKGAIITTAGSSEYDGLPLILGARNGRIAGPILDQLVAHPEILTRITALQYQGGRRWDVIFENGFVFKLPENDPATAIDRLVRLEEIGDPVEKLARIDMRDEKNAFFVKKTQADHSDQD